jgi:hypothetical protein
MMETANLIFAPAKQYPASTASLASSLSQCASQWLYSPILQELSVYIQYSERNSITLKIKESLRAGSSGSKRRGFSMYQVYQ